MPIQPNEGVITSLNMRIPWGGMKPGQGVFLPGADRSHFQAIRTAASRRKISISLQETEEAEGKGVRVTVR